MPRHAKPCHIYPAQQTSTEISAEKASKRVRTSPLRLNDPLCSDNGGRKWATTLPPKHFPTRMAWQQTGFSPSLQHGGTGNDASAAAAAGTGNVHAVASQSPSVAGRTDLSSLPITSPPQSTPVKVEGPSRKRKKSEVDGVSPSGSLQVGLQPAVRQHPVKRACNQCRQQKVSHGLLLFPHKIRPSYGLLIPRQLKCNIVTDPEFQSCSRCVKHHLHCAIDPGFRRQEKRQRTVEMEKEIEQLRAELVALKARERDGALSPHVVSGPVQTPFPPHSPYASSASNAQFLGPNEAAASRSLLELAHGYEGDRRQPTMHTLGRVALSDADIADLYSIFFDRYHPFLPLLQPDFPYTAYYSLHPLLHWAIMTVAARHYTGVPNLMQELKEPFHDFIWYTIANVPQTYHVVKALCLACVWPLPTNSTSTDPSMMVCGAMIQLAMQFGLHRPSHAQDFSRCKIELREEEIRDRMNTWVACNLIAQNISTGYGMPQISRWNWFTHGLHLDHISPALVNRCKVERFIEKTTRALYTMQRDEVGPSDEAQRALTIDTFGREYDELQTSIQASDATHIDMLHVHIAGLHLRLTALFDNPSAANYVEDLRRLYLAASTLLHTFLKLPTSTQPPPTDNNNGRNEGCVYATNYIMQMVLAAGFTLLKLLNSFFATSIDLGACRSLFLATVTALRSMSVERNDLPQRLAEVLAQLWQTSPQGTNTLSLHDDQGVRKGVDGGLMLKIRCRMSMSLLYDSVWRWKEEMGASASKTLDRAVHNPTIPGGLQIVSGPVSSTSNSDSGAAHVTTTASNLDPGLGGDMMGGAMDHDMGGLGHGMGVPVSVGGQHGLNDWPNDLSFAPFDSVGWALDSFLDMNGINNEGFMGL